MILVIATLIWLAVSLLVPHVPRHWWHATSIGLMITAPVLVILAAQDMGPDVAGLMSVALMLMLRNPLAVGRRPEAQDSAQHPIQHPAE